MSYSNFDGYIDETRAYRACREPGATRMYVWYDNYSGSGHGLRVNSKQFTRDPDPRPSGELRNPAHAGSGYVG